MDVLHSSLAGIPTPTAWSQSFAVRMDGIFFGVVVSVHDLPDVATVGKNILTNCTDAAREGMTRERFLSLFKQWGNDGIDIGAVLLSSTTALLFTQGGTTIRLNREGNEQVLMTGGAKGAYVEGPLASGDTYEVATITFVAQFPTMSAHRTPQEMSDEYVAKLHGLSDSSHMCALFVRLPAQTQKTVIPVQAPVASPKNIQKISLPKLPVRLHVPQISLARLLPQTQKAKQAYKILLGLCGVVLVLGLLSLYVTMKRNSDVAQAIKPYQDRFDSLVLLGSDKKLDEMSGLRELSRDMTSRKKDTKDTALARRLDQLLSRVDQTFASISGEKHIDKLRIFYDFRLITADFVASSIAYDIPGKLAVFLDGSHSRLLSLSLEKKEALTLTVDEKLAHPLALAVDSRKAFVLGNEGIMRLSLPLDVMGSIIVNRDGAWSTPKLVDTFGTNIYVLDSGARNLLKYDLEDPSASPAGWLRNKEGVDFDQITSLRIDGSVWMGTRGGKIFHFVQGAPVNFAYTGVLEPPASPVYIYTSQESQKLYVLEPHAARLLVLSKDGTYQELITSNDFSTATGVVVDETTNKAYVLSGSLVYEVEL